MNTALFKQADSRWGSKPYPTRDCTMSGAGCGCVACTHIVIEQDRYKNYTPENLRTWMVNQGFAIRNQGTTWSGITKTLQHFGYTVTHIGISDPMSKAWAELNKGNRIGIILFKGGRGPNGTVWTASGHYVAFTDYKVVDGKHYFYTKDSGGRNHDSVKYGYYSYENSMKGVVYQMWIVQRINPVKTTTTSTTTKAKTTTSSGALTVDGSFGPASVKAAQKYFGTTQDGIISGQTKASRKYYPGISESCIKYGSGGSALIRAIQKKVGSKQDGYLGPNTIKGIQKLVGVAQDGVWGSGTSKAFQTWLNKQNGSKSSTPKTTTTTTKTTTTTTPKVEEVVDVSYVQSSIDWAKVKAAGIAGAIVRCGYRGYGSSGTLKEDSMFLNHIKGAYNAGLKVGIYFFTEAINEAEGKEEARFALQQLKKSGVKLTYPIAVDTENINASNPTPRANANRLSVANRTAAIKGFCEEIKKNGYEPMIYASTSWLNNQLNMSKLPYKVWVAQYNTSVTYKGSYIMWQYTSTGRVNGINGVVDKSHSYYALGNTKPTTSTSTTTKPSTTTTTKSNLKSIAVIAQEVLDGKWGSGDERKKKLTAAGYNYNTVQAKVNELIKIQNTPSQTNKIDQIVLEIFDGKWGSGDARKQKLQAAGYNYEVIQKRVTEVAAHMKSRKEAMRPWFNACEAQYKWSYNAKYNWGNWDKTIASSKNWGTCITFPNVVAMRCGLIKEHYKYITSAGSDNDDQETLDIFYNSSKKAMNSINGKYWSSVKYYGKTTAQLVREGKIKEGDIIGFMGHTATYAYKDNKGNLLFNHAGHAAGIYDNSKPGSNRAALNVKSSYMANRKVYGVFSVNTFIVLTSCTNGTITYSDRYMAGQNAIITIKPNSGYVLKTLKVDGKVVSPTTTYKINKIDSHHIIEAICEKKA